jgi:hypothetical protein
LILLNNKPTGIAVVIDSRDLFSASIEVISDYFPLMTTFILFFAIPINKFPPQQLFLYLV